MGPGTGVSTGRGPSSRSPAPRTGVQRALHVQRAGHGRRVDLVLEADGAVGQQVRVHALAVVRHIELLGACAGGTQPHTHEYTFSQSVYVWYTAVVEAATLPVVPGDSSFSSMSVVNTMRASPCSINVARRQMGTLLAGAWWLVVRRWTHHDEGRGESARRRPDELRTRTRTRRARDGRVRTRALLSGQSGEEARHYEREYRDGVARHKPTLWDDRSDLDSIPSVVLTTDELVHEFLPSSHYVTGLKPPKMFNKGFAMARYVQTYSVRLQ